MNSLKYFSIVCWPGKSGIWFTLVYCTSELILRFVPPFQPIIFKTETNRSLVIGILARLKFFKKWVSSLHRLLGILTFISCGNSLRFGFTIHNLTSLIQSGASQLCFSFGDMVILVSMISLPRFHGGRESLGPRLYNFPYVFCFFFRYVTKKPGRE